MTSLKGVLIVSLAGTITALVSGIIIIVLPNARFGWWLVASAIAGTAVVGVMLLRGQRSLRRYAQGTKELSPSGEKPSSARNSNDLAIRDKQRWVGSASVPGAMGYTEIGIFLAVTEVCSGNVTLQIRPTFIRLAFGIKNLSAIPGDGTLIFPAHKIGQKGIGIKRPGQPPYYFWTSQRIGLLASLAAAGFEVSVNEQEMRR